MWIITPLHFVMHSKSYSKYLKKCRNVHTFWWNFNRIAFFVTQQLWPLPCATILLIWRKSYHKHIYKSRFNCALYVLHKNLHFYSWIWRVCGTSNLFNCCNWQSTLAALVRLYCNNHFTTPQIALPEPLNCPITFQSKYFSHIMICIVDTLSSLNMHRI